MATYSAEVLADSPVRYWKLDDSTGTDTQGNGNLTKGSSGAAPTTGQAGQSSIGSSWSFDGDDQATFTMPSLTTTFTFECFFKSSGGTKLSHTFWRSDGTDIGVVRLQGTSAGAYAGEVYVYIGGAEIHSGTTYNDNAWHHVAVTVNGANAVLYVDGVNKGTSSGGKSSYSFDTTGVIGAPHAGTATEFLIGNLDEVALYTTALSSTRVGVHYAARANADGGHTATAATGSAVMVSPTLDLHPYKIATHFDDTVPVLTKTNETGTAATMDASSGDLVTSGTTATIGRLAFDQFNIASGGELLVRVTSLSNVTLTGFGRDSGGSVTTFGSITSGSKWFRIARTSNSIRYKIWSVGASEPTSWTNATSVSSTINPFPIGLRYSFSGTGSFTLDYLSANEYLTAVLPDVTVDVEPATASGLFVSPTVAVGTVVNVSPATASGSMVSPAFSNATDRNVSVSPATATGLMVDPTVSFEGNVNVNVEPGQAFGEMPGGYYTAPVSVSVTAATASGTLVEPSVTTEHNALVHVDPFTGFGVLEAPAEARQDADDPYYQRILMTTDSDDHWFRLDETTGTVVGARVGGTGAVSDFTGTYVGAYNFNVYGPEGRKAVHFTNGYVNAERSQSLVGEFTFEATIRTTEKDGLLAYGLDNVPNSSNTFRNTIYMKNGKVTIDFGPNGVVTGIKDISDGQWHHVVVSWGTGSNHVLDTGFRIYIDGKLDIRRSFNAGVNTGLIATPDYYFGIPTPVRTGGHVKNFVGDVMEVVFRTETDLDEGTSARLYYAAMGIRVIEVEAATAFGEMAEAKGKGNQKRALVLYFEGINNGPFVNNAGQTYVGEYQSNPDKGDFEFGALIPTPGQIGYEEKLVAQGYRLFYTSVNLVNGAWQYRDPVTDLPMLLDLTKDGIPYQFDLMFYRNFPNEGTELDNLFAQGFTMASLEAHLASLRRCVDAGISLWVSDPYLASLLGIIDRVEFISTLREDKLVREQGDNQMYLWDEHSGITNAWQKGPAYTYYDEYRNNRERVVASIEGMTTTPGTVIKEAQFFTPRDILGWNIQPFFKYEEHPDGLTVGTEYVEPTMLWNDRYRYNYSEPGYGQYRKQMYAVPPGAVKAGTVVTKLANKIWTEGNVEIDNPYKDYAGTIIVEPGDTLKGSTVGGKILFTISQDPRYAVFDGIDTYVRQIVPPDDQLVGTDKENADRRSWGYSAARVLVGSDYSAGAAEAGNVLTQVEDEVGNITYKVTPRTATTLALVPLLLQEKYPTERFTVKNMIQRGLAWLGIRQATAPGGTVVRVEAATAYGEMTVPAVSASKSVVVHADVAIANGTMVSPVGYAKDVNVLVLPATGSGEMMNYERKIMVEPFVGSGVMVDPAGVKAERQTVILTLDRPHNVILYLEEIN